MMPPLMVYIVVALCFPVFIMGQPCPVSSPCRCENSELGRIINCRDASLTAIPPITASDHIFYEITFSSNGDCPGTSTCNNIASIPSGAFSGLKVKKIDLSKNIVGTVANDAFSVLSEYLEELLITGDEQAGFPFNSFRNLTNLKNLKLEKFRQQEIDESNTIKDLANLESLTIENTRELQAISIRSFQASLPKLRTLKLIGNSQLNYYPTGAIRQLVNLRHLSYVQCGLSYIPLDAFTELAYLEDLDLSHNSIKNLDEGSFNGINDTLLYLNLFLNELTESKLQPITTQFWPKLEEFNIGHNKIKNLVDNMFANMPQLQSLKLLHNEITSVKTNSLAGLSSLYYLDLSNNQISTIEAGAFSPIAKLVELILESQTGSILNLTKEAVSGTENTLQILNLDAIELVENEIWRIVRDLRDIRDLRLKSTGITSVPDFVFSKCTKLEYLSLADNSISNISKSAFYGLKDSLHTLDLQDNSLTTISECAFHNFTLEQFFLDNNHINCDCQMLWLFDIIKEKMQEDPLTEYYFTCTCATPTNLADLYLGNVDRNQLCPSQYVPEQCDISIPTTPSILTTPEPTTPQPIGPVLTIHIGAINDDSIRLSWDVTDKTNVTGYELAYNIVGEQEIKRTFLHHTSSQTVLTPLKQGTEYEICITMEIRNKLANVKRECIVETTTRQVIEITTTTTKKPLPVLVIDSSKVVMGADRIHVSWSVNDNSDITGYYLTFHILGTGDKPFSITLHPRVTTYDIVGLESESRYFICVAMELDHTLMNIYKECIEVETPKIVETTTLALTSQEDNDMPIIAGSVVGGIVFVILVIVIVVLLIRYRKTNDFHEDKPVTGHTFNITEKPKLGQESKHFYKPKKNNEINNPSKDVQITVISNQNNDDTRTSGGSYQFLNFDDPKKFNLKPNPNDAYENDVTFRDLPRTPYYSTAGIGYHNKGFNDDSPPNHLYHQPQNTYYDMSGVSETGI